MKFLFKIFVLFFCVSLFQNCVFIDDNDDKKEIETRPKIRVSDQNITTVLEEQILKYGNKADLNHMDVSAITSMKRLFYNFKFFNGDISKWEVSNVTDMESMFENATYFAGDISKWNVSKVTDMQRMFKNTKKFNANISKWNVSNVVDMTEMFYNAVYFTHYLENWNVNKVRFYDDFSTHSKITSQPKFN